MVKANAVGIDGDGKIKPVAIKMVHNDQDEEQRKALIAEVNANNVSFLNKLHFKIQLLTL